MQEEHPDDAVPGPVEPIEMYERIQRRREGAV